MTEGARKLTEEEVEYFIDKADVDQGSVGTNKTKVKNTKISYIQLYSSLL